jgi:UDP-galactopyranose mutase
MKPYDILIVGGGITGCTACRKLVDAGKNVLLIEKSDRLGGLCADRIESGIIPVPYYGPHYFHTDDDEVAQFVRDIDPWYEYRHRAMVRGATGKTLLFPLDWESLEWAGYRRPNGQSGTRPDPRTAYEYAVQAMGDPVYREFFSAYTQKQWGRHPTELPASLFGRVPIRDKPLQGGVYFSDKHCGFPLRGWSQWCKMATDGAAVITGQRVRPDMLDVAEHCIWTAPLDELVGSSLPWRRMAFVEADYAGDMAHYDVLNRADIGPVTRSSRYGKRVAHEIPGGDVPCYPDIGDRDAVARADAMRRAVTKNVTIAGRMGEWKYMDMGAAIRRGLDVAHGLL